MPFSLRFRQLFQLRYSWLRFRHAISFSMISFSLIWCCHWLFSPLRRHYWFFALLITLSLLRWLLFRHFRFHFDYADWHFASFQLRYFAIAAMPRAILQLLLLRQMPPPFLSLLWYFRCFRHLFSMLSLFHYFFLAFDDRWWFCCYAAMIFRFHSAVFSMLIDTLAAAFTLHAAISRHFHAFAATFSPLRFRIRFWHFRRFSYFHIRHAFIDFLRLRRSHYFISSFSLPDYFACHTPDAWAFHAIADAFDYCHIAIFRHAHYWCHYCFHFSRHFDADSWCHFRHISFSSPFFIH